MQKIKVNDEVVVLTGKDSGKKGKVTSLNFKKNVVTVSGANVYKKAVKPSQENPNGGFLDLEKPMHISNVAVVSPKTGAATRVKFVNKEGKMVRVAVKCGSELK